MSENKNNKYYRSLEQLAETPEFQEQLENEFPGGIDTPVSGLSRRRFMQIMSASVAMTTLVGCRWPEEKIVPFAKRAEGFTPGKPVQFATAFEMGHTTLGVLATSYDGRPIKIEGNPEFSLSGGATNTFAQASVLNLYDPDRSRLVLQNGSDVGWDKFDEYTKTFKGLKKGGLAVLTGATTSPSVKIQLKKLAKRYKGSKTYKWEPVCPVNEIEGAELAFGTAAKSQLDLSKAKVIVDFNANVLQDHPTALQNSKGFAKGRDPESGNMNRLYVFENSFSITGGMADHRFPTHASEIGGYVWELAAELVFTQGVKMPSVNRGDLKKNHRHNKHIIAIAKDLAHNKGHSLIQIGIDQSAELHALVNAMNEALGNQGNTVSYLPFDRPDFGTVKDLTNDLNDGKIDTLLILGGDPAYNTPVDLNFADALSKATTIHLSEKVNATSKLSTWHVPQAHYLESWGDATAWDGTVMSVQPLIEPLFGGKTVTELLSLFVNRKPKSAYDIAREGFCGLAGFGRRIPKDNPVFEKNWREYVHAGFYAESKKSGEKLAVVGGVSAGKIVIPDGHNIELSISRDQSIYDGRFIDNAWLQEMPDFMTKLTWDNAAIISPALSKETGLKHEDMAKLSINGKSLEMPIYVLPGQAHYSVTANIGYGQKDVGAVGDGSGFDVHQLMSWSALNTATGLKLEKTGKKYTLATTQDHHAIDESGAAEIQKRVPGLVREGDIEQYKSEPHFVDHMGVHSPPLKSLWKEKEYTGHKWGMAVDLNLCTGCNACLMGCQSENNIAVVGKDEVNRGREMAWLRLDRYFLGDENDPKCTQQPINCAQCELAPCEEVCPVAATMHTDEGLNTMVYNRCVGTRYCSNNCPYKVRRFNWFNNFEDQTETQKLVLNPEVTVRARGVMEKCTFCVQRIESARIDSRVEGRDISDGDITPACGQTCPTDAIVFGDLNDKDSRVSKLREANRSYDLLNYLNLKPRTFYMARIRNPNPEIEGLAEVSHSGHKH
ncbi:TAT-variant-translocated molybdopterin oxidoreductase [bacterium]|jgi:MoCo/4Fe-4S cofactor protein with predicted Tat translocation signal|nr:TAT-variant-translocated molybdopterin oxidoreductase [bacterium]